MKFEVELSEKADRDLRNIFIYIAIDLCAPETAEDEPWHSRGMPVLPVDNYVVLYIPDLEEKIVRIVSVMYSGRDIREQLKQI